LILSADLFWLLILFHFVEELAVHLKWRRSKIPRSRNKLSKNKIIPIILNRINHSIFRAMVEESPPAPPAPPSLASLFFLCGLECVWYCGCCCGCGLKKVVL
jgi:hypothetical protein